MEKESFHIGQYIKKVFKNKHGNHTNEWLAKQLNCQPNNVYNIFRRATIDTELLMKISEVLNYDFFADLSIQLKGRKKSKRKPSLTKEEFERKQEIYDNMMTGISRLVAREIRRIELESSPTKWASLNHKDNDSTSPLPPNKYRVFVLGREDSSVIPHLHIQSLEDKYDFRMGLKTGNFISAKRKPKRGIEIDSGEISEKLNQWFELPSMLNPALTNRELATTMFDSINLTESTTIIKRPERDKKSTDEEQNK